MSDSLAVLPQYLLPKKALTVFAGWIASAKGGAFTTALIRWFVKRYNVNMAEAAAPEISSYAIIARRENNLSDAVEIKVSSAADTAKIISALKEKFQGSVKVSPQITATSAAEIAKLQLPDGARKHRYFVDLRD